MKTLKQIVSQVKHIAGGPVSTQVTDLLWKLICYSPKMPLRLRQEQFLNKAEQFKVTVCDKYFTNTNLTINAFKWGSGPNKILITHGWGSKAADFTEMITALLENTGNQVIAFDAPGCGSSEGDLSSILLIAEAAEAVIQKIGTPDVVIGHSAGAMANVVTLAKLSALPRLLISITPMILLHENFLRTMETAGVSPENQQGFLKSFSEKYGRWPASFNLTDLYQFSAGLNHWLAYDPHDMTLPDEYLQKFLAVHPEIRTRNYEDAGHAAIIKNSALINDVVAEISTILAENS
ncbi:alpha/beta fold hydrolase [Mucilaginibacter glaciei]|uniref:Alpha/beta hydrolase n=1 Tax=Mucilaginibacter glaciei TaxID=2772109 RepID=A0A926NTN0_9SPHI|nr:alpha/beta hydrolase [Mucilaginibacter glaciei]MBD1393765.1 alpha/beta hydrolase [Mucilaginibacter glaciei]